MRVLGIDIGKERVGLAVSDPQGVIASGIGYLERKSFFDKVIRLIEKEKIEEIVVGIPYRLDGSLGPSAEKAISFLKELEKKIDIPIKGWDERLTTKLANRYLLLADLSRKKRKKNIDKLSAQIILQDYLNSQEPLPEEDEDRR